MKKLLAVIICFFASAPFLCSKEQFVYTRISQKEGLTSTINSIYKEQDGDIWIGSQNGLYSFNGNSLRHHTDSIFNGKIIYQTCADPRGNLWILSSNGVILRSTGQDEFTLLGVKKDRNTPFYSMCSDQDGIWIGGLGVIYRYLYSEQELRPAHTISKEGNNIIRNICCLDDGNLLCCSMNGAVVVDCRTGETVDSPFNSIRPVSYAMTDSKGRVWIGIYNAGIEVYENDGTLIKRYDCSNSSLSNNVVLCMTERENDIWVGTDGGGINIIDPEDDTIVSISHVAGDPSSLPAHSIKSLHTDLHGSIWVGSIRDGLINISRSEMITYSDVHIGLDTGISNPTVLCLFQEKDSDFIWIGTDGEGLNRFDPKTYKFTHFGSTLKSKVVSIASYSQDELVLSLYADRICLFNKKTGRLRTLEIDEKDLIYQMRYAGKSVNVINEADGNLLIISNKLYRYDKSARKCREIEVHGRKVTTSSFLYIGASEDGLWMHDNFNIYLIRTGSQEMTMEGTIGERHVIRSGFVGNDNDIWLATNKGLCRFDRATGSFTDIQSSLFREASSVVCDKKSRVWIGTERMLYAYLIDSESFTMFGQSDGAVPNEYLSKPRLLARNGDVYMGGVQGLLHVGASYSIDTEEEPVLSLYSLSVDGHEKTVGKGARLVLPRDSKNLSIGVNVLERDIFRKKMYRFDLSGEGNVYESSRPVLEFKQIPSPGRYEVTVSCTKRDGNWTEPVKILDLRIPQPWYGSWWFIAGMLLLSGAVTFFALRFADRRRAEREELNRKEQEQKAYEGKVQMLINISHELRTPLTLIMAPLKRLIKESDPDEENIPALKRIYRQSVRMRDLLNMVLDLRKMEAGKNRLNMQETQTGRWIEEVAGDLMDEGRSENIDIRIEIGEGTENISIDRQKCETVLMNILMNAVKHSTPGDTISIRTELRGEMVRISVSDEGPGLGDIDMSQMFTRFYQSGGEKYGSGIGLSYSKILVELHGGQIGTYNNEDKGATFWWEIPLHPRQTGGNVVPARAYLNELMGYNPTLDVNVPECETFNTGKMSLMLVDDNKDLLDFIREALSGEFSEVITAESGNRALGIIASGKLPDIIVSDVNMPDGDGYQLCRSLKSNEKYSHIPVVLLTARGEEQSQGDSYRVGADGFIAKPFDIETLVELLRGLLKRRSDVRKRYLDNRDTSTDFGSDEESFIIRFNRIVSEHLSDPELDQQLICRELGVSRALLYNKMKGIVGTGAKEYITKIRIEKAKSLMENSSLAIAEIAEMTGFTSQSYFSTAFKNYTGMTPSQFRTHSTGAGTEI